MAYLPSIPGLATTEGTKAKRRCQQVALIFRETEDISYRGTLSPFEGRGLFKQ